MKKFARLLCVMLSMVIGFTCFSFVACKPKPKPAFESGSIVFSLGEPDKVFNPFFSSSAYDQELIGMTQIGMISTTKLGKPYCGVDEPTVALNYSQRIYFDDETGKSENEKWFDANNPPPADPNKTYSADNYYTRYQFLIKNNIKFSDGEPLTVKDAIFNLYTYLDPVYYGSSTIYSTPIKGLYEYREQKEKPNNGSGSSKLTEEATGLANGRIGNIRYTYYHDMTKQANYRQEYNEDKSKRTQILKDVASIRNMYYDEVVADYNAAVAALQGYLDENAKPGNEQFELGFTEVWEVFLYMEGFLNPEVKPNGEVKVYDQDELPGGARRKDGTLHKKGDKKIDYSAVYDWWKDRDSLIKIAYNDKMGILSETGNPKYDEANSVAGDSQDDPRKPKNPNDPTIAPVCDILTDDQGKAIGSSMANDKTYDDLLWDSLALKKNLYNIVTYYATSSTAQTEFVAEEKQNILNDPTRGHIADLIDGIKIIKLNKGDKFVGNRGTTTLSENQYVLQIDVEGVDPSAIWNFASNVAPMHYYSNADNMSDDDKKTSLYNEFKEVDYRSFNYPVYDKDGNLLPSDGDIWKGEGTKISVGRPYANKNYYDKVLKSTKVISVPMGAGMYMVANKDMIDPYTNDSDRPTFRQFFNNNIAYFIRNDNFYTTSGEGVGPDESSINNCHIKYVRYQVVATDKLLSAIFQGQIDFGDPSASEDNMKQLASHKEIEYRQVKNNGYGYIGINAKYVPNIYIRRAIMYAMDLSAIKTYYGRFADIIYYPVSSESWASPHNEDNAHYSPNLKARYPYEEAKSAIATMQNLAGVSSDSKGAYVMFNNEKNYLDYTFTIAGASEDHPALNTMQNAATLLNTEFGWNVKVKTDSQALSKLAAGTLSVWAAAWGSAIDPDMYQLYHKDSQSTSVRNWGYPEILANSTAYSEEMDIINDLSTYITEARSILDEEERAEIYWKCYNKVLDLAVELPTYQRTNVYAYNSSKIDTSTFNQDPSAYRGLTAQLWKLKVLK